MGMLIKDTEIPTEYGALELKVWSDGQVEIIDVDGEYKTSEAVSVPKHGRLIDADTMIASIKRQTGILKIMGGDLATMAEVVEKGFLQEIENAPTIIEAENDETWAAKEEI